MADSEGAFTDLVAHARDAHVVVIGGGIAGLAFAYECAKVGIAVTVYEMDAELGGTISSCELDGVRIDTGATSWQAASTAMRDVISELGLDDLVVSPTADQTWVADPARGWAAPLPEDSVLGIPANAWDESVRRIIGWGGTWRAYLDRVRPPLTIGVSRNLGALVRSRMGAKVVNRIVAPLSLGRFGIAPDDVDVEIAAPGLNTALTRTGSLGAAVSEQLLDRTAGPSVVSLAGGMTQLVAALVARIGELGGVVRANSTVTDVEPSGEDGWQVHVTSRANAGDDEPEQSTQRADVVVFAGGQDATRDLLARTLGAPLRTPVPAALIREVVTLVVSAPALDSPPRGTTIFAVAGSSEASGVVHQNARWQWLADEMGIGRHAVSVAFDSDASDQGLTSDDEAAQRATVAAAQLLGVDLTVGDVRASHCARFTLDRPASARGHGETRDQLRTELANTEGLVAVGAWLSGSGLAQVVADAVSEADRVRSTVIWGNEAPN